MGQAEIETTAFNTRMFNDCTSINKLLYNKDDICKKMLQLLTDSFSIGPLRNATKFGICAIYNIVYDDYSTDIVDYHIASASLYVGKYKIKIKTTGGIEALDNILNYPMVYVEDPGKLEIISNYLFNNSSLPSFLINEVEFDQLLQAGYYGSNRFT